MILSYIEKIFSNLKGLSHASIASLTKEHGPAVHFLKILMKSLELMSDERFSTIC